MKACSKCKFAALCLSGDFKEMVVRCTICGHFRWYSPEDEYVDIDVPACLSIPKLPKNRCHLCAKGAHDKIQMVWPPPRVTFMVPEPADNFKDALRIANTYGRRMHTALGVPKSHLFGDDD